MVSVQNGEVLRARYIASDKLSIRAQRKSLVQLIQIEPTTQRAGLDYFFESLGQAKSMALIRPFNFDDLVIDAKQQEWSDPFADKKAGSFLTGKLQDR